MNPDIKNGDRLIIELADKELIRDNQIYFFFYNGQFFVKRLIRNVDNVVIKSDNPENIYKTGFIENENIKKLHIIGSVTGLIR